MRRALLLLWLALPAWVLAALGPRYGGELRVAVLDLPASLDPAVPQGIAERLVLGLVHQTLLSTSSDGLLRPELAAGWSSAAAGKEWTLRLKSAESHDGHALTAEDVLRSLRRFLRSDSPAARRLAASIEGGAAYASRVSEDLAGLLAPDAGHVVLRLPRALPLPLLPLAAPAAAITAEGGAGCGPFLITALVPGRSLSLLAFGGHVSGRPFLDRVSVLAYPDARALQAGLLSGAADVGPGDAGSTAPVATLLLVLDTSRAPFNHPDLRAGVSAAIDRVELVRRLLRGGDPAPSLLSQALLPTLPTPETATASHGGPGGRGAGSVSGPAASPAPWGAHEVSGPGRSMMSGSITMAVSTDVPLLVSQRVVAHLASVGLEVSVQPAAPALAARNSQAQVRLLLLAPEVPEPGLTLHQLSLLAPDPAADEALAAADLELNPDRRRVHLLRAEAALRAARVLVPLATVPIGFKLRRGLHDARVDLAGRLGLEDAWLEPQ